ncbi:TetR/AcrR family transcriptional regulator [Solimonas sp. K1W22B-7]|uniref:TetR/AcrR family transcriptional regulator n=1 Tax=Solimonas sp. K1W22B-7 TaxID=2303331 RepID=UPI0013C4E13F|nr:TetR/AcrR family transcriptional regulator [Solimonas sp. K1W22B-7]
MARSIAAAAIVTASSQSEDQKSADKISVTSDAHLLLLFVDSLSPQMRVSSYARKNCTHVRIESITLMCEIGYARKMNDLSTTTARKPYQVRGQLRVQSVLEGARQLLLEGGLEALTIPALAARLGFSRKSIYHFFPTAESILNALSHQALEEFERRAMAEGAAHPERRWREQIAGMVRALTHYFNEDAIAQLVILGSGLMAEGFKAQSHSVRHLSEMTHRMFAKAGRPLPREPIDAVELMVDIGMTVFRMSVRTYGRVSPRFEQEIVDTMVRYLEPHVAAAAAGAKSAHP